MGPLQAMDRSMVAAPLRRSLASTPPPGVAARRLRIPAVALIMLLALAAVFVPALRGGASHAKPAAKLRYAALADVPATARAQVSTALGADEPAFAAKRAGDSVRTVSGPQGLSANFDATGVQLASRGIAVSLSLRGIGVGNSLRALTRVNPAAHANRVSYARGGALTEWYVNGPAGVEQGFTLTRAPAHAARAPLTLSLALGGDAHASLTPGAQSLTLRNGAQALRYTGLVATDASSRALRSWLALDAGHLLIHVDAAHARYPLRIDPLIEAAPGKLTGPGEEGEGLFGTSVALSADGSTLLVGGPRDGTSNRGAAWVFTRAGSARVAQGAKLTGAEGTAPAKTEEEEQCAEESGEEAGECAFGASVALSADGSTALIGEPSATARAGSAWVFKRTGSGTEATWAKAIILTGEGASGEGRFGKSVALSADGATALIGDPSANQQRGSAWVFALSGVSSTVQGRLADAEASHFDHVGRSVALSGDGDMALIGAPGDAEYAGAALVFTRAGEAWSRQPGRLTGAAETGPGRFGKSVALSGDGETAFVGAPNDDESVGAAWGFIGAGGSFTPQGDKLVGTAAAGGHFGASVALSGDGSVGLIGAPRAGGGQVTQYVHTGSGWSSQRKARLAGAAEIGKGWQGTAVALSSEGNLAAVGAPHDHARVGAAWVFAETPAQPPAVRTVLPGFGPAGTVVRIEGTDLLEASAVSFGSVPATSFAGGSPLAIEAVAPAGEGIVDVTVRTPAGVSAINTGDRFRFTAGGAGAGGPGNKGHGGTTSTTPENTTSAAGTTSDPATKAASGGVLGTTSSSAGACQVRRCAASTSR